MKRTRTLALLLAVLMCLSTFMMAACGDKPEDGKKDDPVTPGQKDDPQIPEEPGEKDDPEQPAKGPLTLYVATTGTAEGNGTEANPFASIEAARDYVRALDKTGYSSVTVLVGEGTYRVQTLVFDAQDSGTETCPVTYKANGEVTIDAGVTLKASDFAAVTDSAVLARLSEQAQQSVVCLDLSKYGVGPNDYGKIYAIGSYNTAGKYDGDWVGGQYAELFYNDRRMTVARYPNEGWLNTGRVLAEGQGLGSQLSNQTRLDWDTLRNPSSDRYRIDADLAARMASWQTFDGVWMFGYWSNDWADASTPIGDFNAEACEMSPKFVGMYGAKADAPFYFFNVFEELDAPGEWYLDRENAILYLYPEGDIAQATVSMSLSTGTVVTMNGVKYFTFDGFTVKGTRGDAFYLNGDHNVIGNCLVKCVGGSAMSVNGTYNQVINNEITRTGKGGISVNGGDMVTLTRGENLVENNLIHDWSEVYRTYQSAIFLGGCGNTALHNEIFNSPHMAIGFSGPYQIVKYNVLHDLCLFSADAGAVYAGRNWTSYGCEVSNNLLYNVGTNDLPANGIYMDDCISGITICNNVLVDVWGSYLLLGGGRDFVVENNVLVRINVPYDSGRKWGISYDQRAYDGITDPSYWFEYSRKGNGLWTGLYDSPWQTDIWKEAFPNLARVSDDFDSIETNPYFGANPGCSVVKNNVAAGPGYSSSISAKALQFSEIEEVKVVGLEKLMRKYEEGDYSLYKRSSVFADNPDFHYIDVSEMGRQTK